MNIRGAWTCGLTLLAATMMASPQAIAQQQRPPNILFIMGDDVGWFNIGAYHQGIMSGRTPNLDRLAARACGSPTTMPKQVAQRAGPISSPANCRSGPD